MKLWWRIYPSISRRWNPQAPGVNKREKCSSMPHPPHLSFFFYPWTPAISGMEVWSATINILREAIKHDYQGAARKPNGRKFENMRCLAFVKVLFVKQTTISRTTDTMSGIRVVTTSYLTISLHQWLLGMWLYLDVLVLQFRVNDVWNWVSQVCHRKASLWRTKSSLIPVTASLYESSVYLPHRSLYLASKTRSP